MGLRVFVLTFAFVPFSRNGLHLLNQLLLVRNIEHIARRKDVVGQPAECVFCFNIGFVRTEDNADKRIIVRLPIMFKPERCVENAKYAHTIERGLHNVLK